ncbi:MAG: peroxide stress protein YaaA [Solobacterium sp.]|nr:peroxide stress protein YaaA [Solobacterium sp.]
MQVILSPAKNMVVNNDDILPERMPCFIKQAEILKNRLRKCTRDELKKIWKCSDKLTDLNLERLQHMDLENGLSPALFSYIGLAFQHIGAAALTEEELRFLDEHLYILSGFYGALRPLDGIVPYRLEMQAVMPDGEDLYTFWGDRICRKVTEKDHVIVNLASKEYSRSVEPYLTPEDTMITIVFAEEKGNKLIQKGTMAKMARGEMVSYIAENRINDPEKLKAFHLHYHFDAERSSDTEYVFVHE